jgi:hypothetical protein
MIDDQGNAFRATLVWGSQTVYGSLTDVDDKADGSVAGFADDADAEWTGIVADFTSNTPPGLRAAVTVAGVAYIVASRPVVAQDGISITLRLKRR